MKRIFGAMVLALLLCAAKATVGVDFRAENLPQLEVGRTTLSEAVALLGADPVSSKAGESGATGYTWQYVESKASMWTGKGSTKAKLVVLVFNTDGTFQRIYQMQGITLDPESHKRLFAEPAAAHAQR